MRPGAVSVTKSYDNLNRLTGELGTGTGVVSATRSFQYDLGGRLTVVGGQTFGYDSRNNLRTASGTMGSSTYTYDLANRMTGRADAAGTSTFDWTARSQLLSIVTNATTSGYTWYPSGELDTVTYPGSTSRKYMYDDLGRPVSDVVKNSSAVTISSRLYEYNEDSTVKKTTITQPGNTAAGVYLYGYDRGARLTSMTSPSSVVTNYGYDLAGNRTSAGSATFVYDARNRLLSGGGTVYNWTPRGTLSSTTGTGAATYVHDGLDRLTQAGTVTYAYDSLDRVATRTVGGVATAFSYAGVEMDPVAEGAVTKYLRGPSGQSVHGIVRNGTMAIAGVDRHGDVSFTLSTAGAVIDTKVSDPFGKTLGATGIAPNVGFQSDYTDPTSGLVWMGARWYNPNTGTFTARDTMPGSVGAYATMNRYTYGLNNPVTFNDPTGRHAMDADGGGGNAAPPDCDNACQYAHLQQTGNLYDDPGDSYNDKFQNGDLDATTEIHEDADGNPVIVVYNDIGISSSSAGRTVTYPLGGTQTTTPSAGNPTSIGTVVSTDPLIPAGAISLANASAFGPKVGPPKFTKVGEALVQKHSSLIEKIAKTVGVNASVIAKILIEENNFYKLHGAAVGQAEQLQPFADRRLGVANMHQADAAYLYGDPTDPSPEIPRYSADFIFGQLKAYIPKGTKMILWSEQANLPYSVDPTAANMAADPSFLHQVSASSEQVSIAFLALVLGTTKNYMATKAAATEGQAAVTSDEALILSRKVAGWAGAQAYWGEYDTYRETVEKRTPYGSRSDIMNIGPGQRPAWLDRYDQYDAKKWLG